MKSIIKNIKYSDNEFYALGVKTMPDGEIEIVSILKVTFLKTSLEFEKFTIPQSQTIETWLKGKNLLVHLSNDNAIWKLFATERTDEKSIANKVLPDVDLDQFCMVHEQCRDKTLAALIRIEHLNSVSTWFKSKGAFAVSVSWGPVAGVEVLNMTTEGTYSFDDQLFSLNDVSFTSQNIEDPDYDLLLQLDGKVLNSSEALALGTAIGYLKKATSQFTLAEVQEELKFRSWFHTLLKYSALILIPVLLLSLFVSFKLSSELANLESAHLMQNTSNMEFTAVKSVIDKKLELISETGINKRIDAAFCLDRLGASLPAEIVLNKVVVYPIVDELQRDEPVDINYEQILVLGESPNTAILNYWIRDVEQFPWVQKVNISHYQSDEIRYAQFKLILNLADTEL